MTLQYDLEGWKDIAAAIRRSVAHAKRLAARGMPVTHLLGRVSAVRAEIVAWCLREGERILEARRQERRHRPMGRQVKREAKTRADMSR
jgi:hypothetical protein